MREQIERAKSIPGEMSYRALDMYYDPHALVIANPPTYLAGFEKYYDAVDNMTIIFDPAISLKQFMDLVKNAKCLAICYEENVTGKIDIREIRCPKWSE